jgi:glutathione S-transferase
MDVVRVARANIRHHMRYIGYLTNARNGRGDRLTYADFAAAAHISCADYLGDAPWDEDEAAKHWYQRIKSRPRVSSAAVLSGPDLRRADTMRNWISTSLSGRRRQIEGSGAAVARPHCCRA